MSRNSRILAGLLFSCLLPGTSLAQAPGHESAVIKVNCNYECLIGMVDDYVAAMARRDLSRLPLADDVVFSENDVVMPLGNDGLWGTVNGVHDGRMAVADEITGNAAWFGIVEEHGNPAFLAIRMKVKNRLITEIEAVVTRLPDMPKPFGDPKTVTHDPVWNDVLPEVQRRPRERLVAVADGYFNTVELNDGDVFTLFDDDCARLENGILTTASPQGGDGGNAANIASGCEAQFKLGIYRINKRIRDRRYPIVDEKRGVVVASGFFDHANTFDRYTLTDGREMRTVLKWPNSITLLEAFKIRNGRIWRIEAVFTYVPYFMPSPFAHANPDFQTR